MLPIMIELIESNKNVAFLDEAVYTSKQINVKVWHPKGGEAPTQLKNALGFPAVAVVGAIDVRGNLIAVEYEEMSIKYEKLCDILKQISNNYLNEECYVFLDNLPLHHNKSLAVFATSLKVRLIFNAPSSCELNPIERLWAWSK